MDKLAIIEKALWIGLQTFAVIVTINPLAFRWFVGLPPAVHQLAFLCGWIWMILLINGITSLSGLVNRIQNPGNN